MRSLDHLGRSGEAKDRKKQKKVKCDRPKDRQTDGPTKRGVELRSTQLKRAKKKQNIKVNNGITYYLHNSFFQKHQFLTKRHFFQHERSSVSDGLQLFSTIGKFFRVYLTTPHDLVTFLNRNKHFHCKWSIVLSRLKSQWEAKNNRSFQQNLTIQLNPALTYPQQTEFLL